MKSASGNLNANIDNILMSRFSTGNVLPKTKNTQLKSIEERNHNLTPNNQSVLKNNLKIHKNNRAIEQIARTQSIEDKKGVLKLEGYQPQVNESFSKKMNAIQNGNSSTAYTKEEFQGFSATIPIRGSYRESNASSLPKLLPKQLGQLQDKKKSSKKVTINMDNLSVQHIAKDNLINSTYKQVQEKITDKQNRSDFDGVLSSKNYENIETNAEKQFRIDGQIKKYMQKIGLKKRDKFPVFYTLDENGNEVKTSLANPQTYTKFTNQQQPYLLQQKTNTNNQKQQNYLEQTKSRKLNRAGISEEKLPSQNENLEDIMKICSEFQKTIVNFDKKNQKNAKRNTNDFRKLSNQMKQLDLQNLIIQEADDPALQPYFQHLQQSGRVKEPKMKDLLDS